MKRLSHSSWLATHWWLLALCLALGAAHGQPQTQPQTLAQARASVTAADAQKRLAAVERLGAIGTMADVDRLVARLADADVPVRQAATASLWRVWSRSGDPDIDALLLQGSELMQGWAFDEAVATFSEIVRRKPDFAEGWNKRATVLFLIGEYEASLRDCDEVLRRNPKHFGALAGAGQNHQQLGHLEQAIDFYKRALMVNPNLPGPAASIIELQRQLKLNGGSKI